MKIVVANSIGRDRKGNYIIHSPSRWSEAVKNKYHWFAYYPWELAYLSALLKHETKHRVKFVDGCLMRLGGKDYYKHIIAESPDMLVIESATRMIEENVELALKVKAATGAKIVFVGPHASAFPQKLIDMGIDYVCVGEYELTVLEIVQSKKRNEILGLYPNVRRPLLDIKKLPWPEDNDVSRLEYAYPGEPSSEFREIQMYATRGCPGSCNFCVARHVYYNKANWRPREVTDVINEIKHLRDKYPLMQGVFFDEEVHNADRQFVFKLTEAIIENGLSDLRFEAMCDVRFLDAQVMRAMKNAGYYKLRIGIESASEKVMKAMGKTIDLEKIVNTLKTAKSIGLKTYGTFTFGALGSDVKEDEKTIKLMRDLIKNNLLDNLQLSICTPQPGTPFYEHVRRNSLLRKNIEACDYDGGIFAVIDYPNYTHRQIEAMKRKALVIRDHYFMNKRIKDKGVRDWIISAFRRYGWWGVSTKAFLRIINELCFVKIIKLNKKNRF
ncbi:MAG: B12-binding domain-containing radical SAM protein [Candidatus Omnitrophica bacterium]|nr:B12-binding domain-containing radical SAM protein [Candidatus Omnitrophota bacterium]